MADCYNVTSISPTGKVRLPARQHLAVRAPRFNIRPPP